MKTAEQWLDRWAEIVQPILCEQEALETAHRDFICAIQADAQPTAGWMPISSAPNKGEILTWVGYRYDVVDTENTYEDARGKHFFNGDVFVIPTHWQPLPPPPSDSKPIGEK